MKQLSLDRLTMTHIWVNRCKCFVDNISFETHTSNFPESKCSLRIQVAFEGVFVYYLGSKCPLGKYLDPLIGMGAFFFRIVAKKKDCLKQLYQNLSKNYIIQLQTGSSYDFSPLICSSPRSLGQWVEPWGLQSSHPGLWHPEFAIWDPWRLNDWNIFIVHQFPHSRYIYPLVIKLGWNIDQKRRIKRRRIHADIAFPFAKKSGMRTHLTFSSLQAGKPSELTPNRHLQGTMYLG